MNIIIKILVTALILLLVVPAQAMDGNDLVAAYNSYKRTKTGVIDGADNYSGGMYDGYVLGIFQSAQGLVVCVRGEFKNGEVQEVVGQFLDTHPTILQRSALLLTTQALMKAYPCK